MASDRALRLSVDIGGTFTDLVIEENGEQRLFKSPTVPTDPVRGILNVLQMAADSEAVALSQFLARAESFSHATTIGLNAVLTGKTALTAFLTTEGHPDILLLREGGRRKPFDFTVPFPAPYVPRRLTFEVPERMTAAGTVLQALDEAALDALCDRLRDAQVEAIAVCLLWATINPAHELKVAAALDRHLPGVPYTLSHRLNPSLREYRRASSVAIDASLKPLMSRYIAELTERLTAAGLACRILMVTSLGGVMNAEDAAAAPVVTINSGPSMAPVAGRAYAAADVEADTVIVADAGGTTYDVTLVRRGEIPSTRSAWVGEEGIGHMTGLPSIDVKSVGAGGGSIAWVDEGSLLHVGPQSAGAMPGPACYGRGGQAATVTDAALVLGYLDAAHFANGSMTLDIDAALAALTRDVAQPLGLDTIAAAHAVLELTTEQMVHAIEEITLQQGIDPARAVLVGGGGAAGINAVAVARRLGSRRLIIPVMGAALAASGALMSDITTVFTTTLPVITSTFDRAAVNAALARLTTQAQAFAERVGAKDADVAIAYFAEARYPQQIWELEVPLRAGAFAGPRDIVQFSRDFHATHREILGISDDRSPVEIVSWSARVNVALGRRTQGLGASTLPQAASRRRRAYVQGTGLIDVPVRPLANIRPGETIKGPVLIESPFTTIVVADRSRVELGRSGSLLISPPDVAQAEGKAA